MNDVHATGHHLRQRRVFRDAEPARDRAGPGLCEISDPGDTDSGQALQSSNVELADVPGSDEPDTELRRDQRG